MFQNKILYLQKQNLLNMKVAYFLPFILLLLNTVQLFGQAKGNINYSKERQQSQSPRQQQYNQNEIAQTGEIGAPIANIPNNEYIDIEGSVLYNTKPDNLVAIFNVVQLGETASEVNRIINERINGFLTDVQKLGIKPEQAFIDMVSLIPVYEVEVEKKMFSKNYIEVPKGFELQKNIHISFSEERKLNDILTAASQFEIYDIVRVDYIVNDSKKIHAQMQEEASSTITAKLEKFKKMGVNFSINNRVLADNVNIVYPTDRYQSYQAFSSASLDAKKKQGLQVNQVRKPVSYYYNKVSESTFDVVINPHVLEPVVQYIYTLKVRYPIDRVLPTPPVGKEKEIWLITPSGDLKLIPR